MSSPSSDQPRARLSGGWVVVPYNGDDGSVVEIAVGDPSEFRPAYLAWRDTERVAQVRPGPVTGDVAVWLRVDGVATKAGRVGL